jgi:poly-gamma-glutamate capsule biosynthesis protein CapA/YwtB (metallophosphatase superfamily)
MYFINVEASTGKLVSLNMAPMQIRRFRVNNATNADALWLKAMLNTEGERLGCRVELKRQNMLLLMWK